MRKTAAQYREQLAALLPLGAAWPREGDSVLGRVLLAVADELARLDARAWDLVDEADPRTTVELLPEWERAFGLPDPCVDQPDTYGERIDALVEKVTRIGGQSPGYFIAVAARLGYTITITEFDPFTFASTFDELLYGQDWQFAWQVNAPEETVRWFEYTSGFDEPLADWGNEQLECVLTRLKPAHTTIIFAYGG
ncbi:MAG: YmfQ family protein [Gammaproteobacteria bacterium]